MMLCVQICRRRFHRFSIKMPPLFNPSLYSMLPLSKEAKPPFENLIWAYSDFTMGSRHLPTCGQTFFAFSAFWLGAKEQRCESKRLQKRSKKYFFPFDCNRKVSWSENVLFPPMKTNISFFSGPL